MGLPIDVPNKEKHISKFFNENNHLLIYEDNVNKYIRPNEHILKRSISLGQSNFLSHATNSSKYTID